MWPLFLMYVLNDRCDLRTDCLLEGKFKKLVFPVGFPVKKV